MAWTKANVNINTDIADVGTVSATFEDATHGSFTYKEERVKADAGGKAAFVAAANAAKDAWLSEKTKEGNYETALLTALNS